MIVSSIGVCSYLLLWGL